MSDIIYVVEDDPIIQDIYQHVLTEAGYQVQCFPECRTFFQAMETGQPNLIILDIILPGENGYLILQRLRANAQTAAIPIIMVSSNDGEQDKVQGLDLGADDYITKPFGTLELVARVKANLRKISDKHHAGYADISINDVRHEVAVQGMIVSLTFKEYQIIKLLFDNAEKVIDRKAFFQLIWETDFVGESRTLDMHIKELRKKLSENKSICQIKTLRGVGYMLSKE